MLLEHQAWVTLVVQFVEVLQEQIVEQDQRCINRVLDHFFVLLVCTLTVDFYVVLEDEETELFSLNIDCLFLRLGNDVWDGH